MTLHAWNRSLLGLAVMVCSTFLNTKPLLAQAKSEQITQSAITITRDVKYLNPPRNARVDIYAPTGRPTGTRSPAVVVIHGGGWNGGRKTVQQFVEIATTLAAAGYVCISVDYCIDPNVCWPLNIFDCKNAVRFLRANAGKYGVDVDHIGVIGGSAGGHLALMVGFTDKVMQLEPMGNDTPYPGISDRVQAVVDLYGVSDFRTTKNTDSEGNPTTVNPARWNQVFGNHQPISDADRALASPSTHISPQAPPVLIIHGVKDPTVDRDQSIDLDKRLTVAKVPHKLILVPGVGHYFDLENWNGTPLPEDLRPIVVSFFDYILKPPLRTGNPKK